MNGDGVPDLLIGAEEQDVGGNANQGQVYVLSGADRSLLLTLNNPNPQANAFFATGGSVAGVGDITGDGIPDLLVGTFGRGQAFFFSGADGSLIRTLSNPAGGAGLFGVGLAGVGDVNGDSIPDVLIGARDQNKAYVFSGADGSLLLTLNNPTPAAHSVFGVGTATGRVEDINNDGVPDLVVGAGDLSGDGIPDLVIGAFHQPVGGNTFQGRAFVFVGGILRVQIDIKPGSFPNSINLGSEGTVPMAILSSATFDATTVDPVTVSLASAPVKLKGKGTPMASFEDVDGNGLPDLVVQVSTEALQQLADQGARLT